MKILLTFIFLLIPFISFQQDVQKIKSSAIVSATIVTPISITIKHDSIFQTGGGHYSITRDSTIIIHFE